MSFSSHGPVGQVVPEHHGTINFQSDATFVRSSMRSLSLLSATLSALMLIKHGFQVSFASSFTLLLNYYELVIQALFGWAEPWIRYGFERVWEITGYTLTLHPHWKHIFVLLWIYFFADARVVTSYRGYGSALFRIGWGGLSALIAGVAAGTVALNGPYAPLEIVVYPVIGILLYGFGASVWNATFFRSQSESWWKAFKAYAAFSFPFLVLGTLLVVSAIFYRSLPYLSSFSNPGLMLDVLLVILLASYYVLRGAFYASSPPSYGKPWKDRFLAVNVTRVGLYMFATIVSVAAFMLVNVGLKLAGM